MRRLRQTGGYVKCSGQLAEANARTELAERRAEEANHRADVAVALADRTLAQLAESAKRADAERSRPDRAEAERESERNRADLLQGELAARTSAGQAGRLAQKERDALYRLEAIKGSSAALKSFGVGSVGAGAGVLIAAAPHPSIHAFIGGALLALSGSERGVPPVCEL